MSKNENNIPPDASENPPEPKNPYKEGTAKYLVAKALLQGETDRGKIISELRVKPNTVYNVVGEMRSQGYSLAIHQAREKTPPPPPTSPPPSPQTASATTPGGSPGGQPGGTTPPNSQTISQGTAGGVGKNPPSESSKPPSESGGGEKVALVSPPGVIDYDKLAELVAQKLVGKDNPNDPKLPGKEVPMEEVELVGEKVNYKIALNPEIFYRYSIFKARVAREGKEWTGSLSDFIDIATKDILAVYGMHPTVLTTRGGKVLVELPAGIGGE